MIFAHKLVGVGIGTVVAVLGVGRVIALFNHFFMKKMTEAAGVEYLKRKICTKPLKRIRSSSFIVAGARWKTSLRKAKVDLTLLLSAVILK